MEWVDREFPHGGELKDAGEAESTRRTFLKLMSASTALAGAGLAGCRRPEIHIRPYAKAPEWVIPGKVLYYATAMPLPGGGTPLVVNTTEGRPIHLQPNRLHPAGGGVEATVQASILGLYDPDRARGFLNAGKKTTREEFFAFLDAKKAELAGRQGAGLAILTDEVVSPTRQRLLTALQAKFPQAKIYRWEAFSPENVRNAYAKGYAGGVVPLYHFDRASRVFSLDCDFMGVDRIANSATGQFMSGRKAETSADPMNRLYVVEPNYTLTGGMADHRLRAPASQIMKVAVKLAQAIAAKTGNSALGAAVAAVKLNGEFNAGREDYDQWIELAADDLIAAKDKALVVAGSGHGEALHLLTAAINTALGAVGSTVELRAAGLTAGFAGSLRELVDAANAKTVETLLIVSEADPATQAPADLNWSAVQSQIATVIVHSTRHRTATARAATWAVPATHYLEQWGDTRTFDGTLSVVQPMILPLFGGVSDHELLAALLSNDPTPPPPDSSAPPVPGAPVDPGPGFRLVRDTFQEVVPGANDDLWNTALRDGFVANTAYPAVQVPLNNSAVTAALQAHVDAAPPTGDSLEVLFVPCAKIGDGRYINNAWLQEAPDPVSKIAWDNAALLSVRTAKRLGIKLTRVDEADVIQVTVNGVTRAYPVLVIPGQADEVVTLTAGYGQRGRGDEGPGRVGQGTGFDVYGLRTSATQRFATGATVSKLTDTLTADLSWTDLEEIPPVYPIATTQEHHGMYGRALVREGTQDDWRENNEFVLEQGMDGHLHGTREEKTRENNFSFYKPVGRKDENGERVPHLNDDLHQWGMVIDLNRCTGCNSCLIACQSENNIPVVGKDQVRRGREMHWIRMDRYFATDLDSDSALNGREPETRAWDEDQMDEPEMLVQPVACQHCEAAPCETVCPVNATVHSPDGLNVMVYNRCIGTRYCANNCPFKARRFNYFDYNKRNPLVTRKLGPLEFNNLYAGPAGERHDTELSKLQKNPNVSVRMRGVIEKCTYCLQRIESARIDARAKARKNKARATGSYDESLELDKSELRIPTDGVRTACQDACSAGAIQFGNLLDENSTVSRWKRNPRNYDLLGYLAVRARTSYLARIKNPNPLLLAASALERSKAGQASKSRHIHTGSSTGGHH